MEMTNTLAYITLSVTPIRATCRVGSCPVCKCYTRVEIDGNDKHTSLY